MKGTKIMLEKKSYGRSDAYWDRAGELGYGEAMYRFSEVEAHVRGRVWKAAAEIANQIGIPKDGHILDLGCGDGAFANEILAANYRVVEGIDKSEPAIRRAQGKAPSVHVTFRAADLVAFDYDSLPHYDGAFLIGILHHVKDATPAIVKALARRTEKMVVLEPNGNNLVRKALEFTPSYRSAGEDSFRTKELHKIFEAAGWRTVTSRRLNIFPNFTPAYIYRLIRSLQPWIEQSRFWSGLCTVGVYGLVTANERRSLGAR